MGLADKCESLLGGLLANPHLPQRTVATQRRRHHLVDQASERTGRPVQMTVDRERLVVHPLGRVQPERHRRELLAVARRARQASRDVLAQLEEIWQRS